MRSVTRTSLWRRAVAGGRQAFGHDRAGIAIGAPAELLEIRVSDPALSPDEALDDLVFAQRATRPAQLAQVRKNRKDREDRD